MRLITGIDTTYETIYTLNGNQKIVLSDAENITGITLFSSNNDLGYGRIAKTVFFGELRDEINITLSGRDRGYWQTLSFQAKIVSDGLLLKNHRGLYTLRGTEGRNAVQLAGLVVIRSMPRSGGGSGGGSGGSSDGSLFPGETTDGTLSWLDRYRNK